MDTPIDTKTLGKPNKPQLQILLKSSSYFYFVQHHERMSVILLMANPLYPYILCSVIPVTVINEVALSWLGLMTLFPWRSLLCILKGKPYAKYSRLGFLLLAIDLLFLESVLLPTWKIWTLPVSSLSSLSQIIWGMCHGRNQKWLDLEFCFYFCNFANIYFPSNRSARSYGSRGLP